MFGSLVFGVIRRPLPCVRFAANEDRVTAPDTTPDRTNDPMTADETAPSLGSSIVAIAAHRDRSAFARLFAHFAPRVKAYMMRLGASPAQAEDLAQETMLTVWRKAALYDPGRAEASTWVFTIARNLRIDAMRRERHPEVSDAVLTEFADERPGADVQAAERHRNRRLRDALATLPAEQAEVVRLSFFADIAHPAIAERLGVPLGTVKSRLRLAMVRIRKALGEDEA